MRSRRDGGPLSNKTAMKADGKMDSNRPDASTVGVMRHYSSIKILNNSQTGCLNHTNSDGGSKTVRDGPRIKNGRVQNKDICSLFFYLLF